MEGHGEMGVIGENLDSAGAVVRDMEDDSESLFGSCYVEGASGDDHDSSSGDQTSKRNKYHRHTPYQIQELEAAYKENAHPDEKTRLELSRRLNLNRSQIKFWFQNRRTLSKTQLARFENVVLKQENNKLRNENIALKEATRSAICNDCGNHSILDEVSMEEYSLRIENARLKDELNRISLLAKRYLGRSSSTGLAPLPPMLAKSGPEVAAGINNFGALVPTGAVLDSSCGPSNALPVAASGGPLFIVHGADNVASENKALLLALTAMDQLVELARTGHPLWLANPDGRAETLNLEEYARSFLPCIGLRPGNFITEATKASGTLPLRSGALVETLMDANRWAELFPCMIGQAATLDVISPGMCETLNGALQLMQAEFQVLSPLVPVRRVEFLRFCKQQAEGIWAVVDISVDNTIEEGPDRYASCRRLPSGCIIQDMATGYSKVTWIEHSEYDENAVHQFFQPLVKSGMGLGAEKWLSTLERQWESYTMIMSPNNVPSSGAEAAGITQSGRRSVMLLAQTMTKGFCAGLCATKHKWETVQTGNAQHEDYRLKVRRSIGNHGEPPGVVLSAAATTWMPVSPQTLFDFLNQMETRYQWDPLFPNGFVQQMLHFSKSQHQGNSISILQASVEAGNGNQKKMLVLQETRSDATGSVVLVYAPVYPAAMDVVLSGGDPSSISMLPQGFSIVPDCLLLPETGGDELIISSNTDDGNNNKRRSGCLLSVGFQMLLSSGGAPAEAKMKMESLESVKLLISRTLEGIKAGLRCS